MIAQPLVVAGFMITATMAGVIDRREETSICGAPKPSEEHMKSYRALIARSAGGGIFDRQTDDDKPIEIATVIHVLAEDNTLEGGMLSNASITKSIDIMNGHYAPAKISFKIQEITVTVDRQLATYGQDHGKAMKQKLRRGDSSVLNLYYVRNLSPPGLKGECTFPTQAGPGGYDDGCAVASDSIPGGPTERRGQPGQPGLPGQPGQPGLQGGLTARAEGQSREERKNDPNDFGITKVGAHEVGHWLGLPHTFSEKRQCEAVGDLPPESAPAMQCRTGQNQCGVTPAQEEELNQNIMSYADCSKQVFTSGQMQFMRKTFRERRQTDGNGQGTGGSSGNPFGNPGEVPGGNPGQVPGGNPGGGPDGIPGGIPEGGPGGVPGGVPGDIPGGNPWDGPGSQGFPGFPPFPDHESQGFPDDESQGFPDFPFSNDDSDEALGFPDSHIFPNFDPNGPPAGDQAIHANGLGEDEDVSFDGPIQVYY